MTTVGRLDKLYKMAASTQQVLAKLCDLPVNFSMDFLKVTTLSLKSKQQGFKYFSEGYIHDVKMFCGDGNSEYIGPFSQKHEEE